MEGATLLGELAATQKIKSVLTWNLDLVPKNVLRSLIHLVSKKTIERLSSLEQSEGVLAELERPENKLTHYPLRMLALDNIQDPGNMGALLRSALAFGFTGILLLNKCCDPFGDKAVRASRGCCFHLFYKELNINDLKSISGFTFIVANTNGTNPEKIKAKKLILVMGNEAHGPSEEVKQLCKQQVSIPLDPHVESLNVAVAGGILMYLLRNP